MSLVHYGGIHRSHPRTLFFFQVEEEEEEVVAEVEEVEVVVVELEVVVVELEVVVGVVAVVEVSLVVGHMAKACTVSTINIPSVHSWQLLLSCQSLGIQLARGSYEIPIF